MKKIVLITIAVLLIGGMTLAVGYGAKATQRSQDTTCENFVDADGDGINDNCPNDGVRELRMPRTEQATGTEPLAKRDRDSAEDLEKQHSCKR